MLRHAQHRVVVTRSKVNRRWWGHGWENPDDQPHEPMILFLKNWKEKKCICVNIILYIVYIYSITIKSCFKKIGGPKLCIHELFRYSMPVSSGNSGLMGRSKSTNGNSRKKPCGYNAWKPCKNHGVGKMMIFPFHKLLEKEGVGFSCPILAGLISVKSMRRSRGISHRNPTPSQKLPPQPESAKGELKTLQMKCLFGGEEITPDSLSQIH